MINSILSPWVRNNHEEHISTSLTWSGTVLNTFLDTWKFIKPWAVQLDNPGYIFHVFTEQFLPPVSSLESRMSELEGTWKISEVWRKPKFQPLKPELGAPKCDAYYSKQTESLVFPLNCFKQMEQQQKKQCSSGLLGRPSIFSIIFKRREVGRATSRPPILPHAIQVLPKRHWLQRGAPKQCF